MLKRKNKDILIRFNKLFYNENAIKKSVDDFSKTFDADIRKKGNYFEIIVKDYVKNEAAAMEFCNYVLGMMKLENRKA